MPVVPVPRLETTLFHFDFNSANPAGQEIVDGRRDDAENKSHHAIDDWHENAEPKHYGAHQCRWRAADILSLLSLLSNNTSESGKCKKRKKNQTQTRVKHSKHLARLQWRDSFDSSFH